MMLHMPIEEDLGSRCPWIPAGREVRSLTKFRRWGRGITSPKPPPSGAITPSEPSVRYSDGALTAEGEGWVDGCVSDLTHNMRCTKQPLQIGPVHATRFQGFPPPERLPSSELLRPSEFEAGLEPNPVVIRYNDVRPAFGTFVECRFMTGIP